YGPNGANLDPASDPPNAREATLRGHPGAGWLFSASPGASVRIRAVWNVPEMVSAGGRSDRYYGLTVYPAAAHQGDRMRLSITLPTGWRWSGAQPPSDLSLDSVIRDRWSIAAD